MTYVEWEQGVPEAITNDPVWQFCAYRKALFLYDLLWEDCEKLMRAESRAFGGNVRGRVTASQAIGSAGSVSANIEEGYGRGYGKDRDHFLRISAGSARETKGWYSRSRHLLSAEVIKHPMALCDEIISPPITELKLQRRAS